MIGVIIMLDEELLHLPCGVSGMIWGMKGRAVRNAWVTANCAYLVVIMTSLTSSGMLLSCETAVGEQISYIHLDCFCCKGVHTEVKRGHCCVMQYMTISQWRPFRRDHSAAA